MSDSLGLVDFAIKLMNSGRNTSCLKLPGEQLMFFGEFKPRTAIKPAHHIELVEITFGLVHVNNSLPNYKLKKSLSLHHEREAAIVA